MLQRCFQNDAVGGINEANTPPGCAGQTSALRDYCYDDNQKDPDTCPIVLLEMPGPISSMDRTEIGCINMYDDMRYEMDITIDGPLTTFWGGVFHCGNSFDVKMPLITRHNASYIGGSSDDFYVKIGEDDQIPITNGLTNVAPLVVGQTYRFDITVDQNRLNVDVDGAPTRLLDTSKPNHSLLTNLQCWVGGGHHGTSPSTVANIRITSTSAGAQSQNCPTTVLLERDEPTSSTVTTELGCINQYDEMRYEMDVTIDELADISAPVFQCGLHPVGMPKITYGGGFVAFWATGPGSFKSDSLSSGFLNESAPAGQQGGWYVTLEVNKTYHIDLRVTQTHWTSFFDGRQGAVDYTGSEPNAPHWTSINEPKPSHPNLMGQPCSIRQTSGAVTVSNIRITSTSADSAAINCPTASPTQTPTAAPTSQCAKQKISWEPVDDSSIVPCYARGDPHFQTFDGQHHNYMGEDNGQYYYVSPCHGASYSDMPFNVIGTHMHWAGTATALKYITLELIEDDDKRHYVYLDGNTKIYKESDEEPSTIWDDGTELTEEVPTELGSKFVVNVGPTLEGHRPLHHGYEVRVSINGSSCGGPETSDLILFVQNGGTSGTMNLVVFPPKCYKEFACGLCGSQMIASHLVDVTLEDGIMRTCDDALSSWTETENVLSRLCQPQHRREEGTFSVDPEHAPKRTIWKSFGRGHIDGNWMSR